MSLPYISVVYHTVMLNFIENVLCYFESCFSRKVAFNWFVTITIGLMLRSDKLGITSVIRDLALSPGCYDSMLHFFRASSWSLEEIRKRWFFAVRLYALLYKEENYHILVGDGVKQSKEGRRMPGVERRLCLRGFPCGADGGRRLPGGTCFRGFSAADGQVFPYGTST